MPKKKKKSPEVLARIEDSRYLKYGDIIKISDTLGISKQAVNGYIRGINNSPRIKIVFDEFVKDRKEKLEKALKENLK